MREIFPRLHCRCCGMLMKPNLSYALVEVTTFDIKSNSFITKPKVQHTERQFLLCK